MSQALVPEVVSMPGHGHSHEGAGHGHSHGGDDAQHGHAHPIVDDTEDSAAYSSDESDNGAYAIGVAAKIRKEFKRKRKAKNVNMVRLVGMSIMTGSFFVVELVVGFMTGSLALISDAFHMLSDLQSLIVGLFAIWMSKKERSSSMSFGWERAEIVGGLINGIFLLSVVFFILLESVERFIEPPEIKDPITVLIVGFLGLVINVIGLVIFGHGHSHGGGGHGHSHGGKDGAHGHAHSGGDHGHAHGGDDHGHAHEEGDVEGGDSRQGSDAEEQEHGHSHAAATPDVTVVEGEGIGKKKGKKVATNLNMHGVFLHVLGDALGSVGVLISGSIMAFTPWEHRFYVDPAISVVIALIILVSTIPLVKRTTLILLQSVPSTIDMDDLHQQLLMVKGVRSLHEFHVWQLIDQTFICSLHVVINPDRDFMTIANRMKSVLHRVGIHSSTIQPEMVSKVRTPNSKETDDVDCALLCDTDCSVQDLCCKNEGDAVKRAATKARRPSNQD